MTSLYGSGQEQLPGASENTSIATARTVRLSSLIREKLDKYAFRPLSSSDDEWVVFCSTGKSFIMDPFRNCTAIAHFRSHGLELVEPVILDPFGLPRSVPLCPRNVFLHEVRSITNIGRI